MGPRPPHFHSGDTSRILSSGRMLVFSRLVCSVDDRFFAIATQRHIGPNGLVRFPRSARANLLG